MLIFFLLFQIYLLHNPRIFTTRQSEVAEDNLMMEKLPFEPAAGIEEHKVTIWT